MKYDKEKWKKEQSEKKENLRQSLNDISKNFSIDPTTMAEYVAFSSKFYDYSVNNTILIYNQNRLAQFVGSYQYFKEEGYNVNRGEKSMQIFVPVLTTLFIDETGETKQLREATKDEKSKIKKGEIESIKTISFKLGNVFDISQTNCPIEDYPKLIGVGYSSNDHEQAYEQLVEFANNTLNYSVTQSKMPLNLRGLCYPQLQEIKLNDNLKDTEKLSTLCHELGHAMLHNQEISLKSITQKETEADMFGIMLQSHFGIELTDLRKLHFKNHYRELESEFQKFKLNKNEDKNQQTTFDDVLNNVFQEFKLCVNSLDEIEQKKRLNQNMDTPSFEQAQELEI